MPLRYTSASDVAGPLDVLERARRYIAKMPAAIAGQHGHDQTFAIACALIQGFDLPRDAAASLISEYNERCQPPWSDRDLTHKLDDADRATPPPEGRGHLARGSISADAPPRSQISNPKSEIAQCDAFAAFLRTCFDPDDIVSIAPGTLDADTNRTIPEHAGVNTLTRDQWLARASERGGIHRIFSSRHGLFVRINPLRRASDGTDADVSELRHVLVESDALAKPEQERILRASGLPIAALIDSAGASIHAWVRVDARNRTEYDARREKVWDALPAFQIDKANKNPSRFSRCPGGLRGDAIQRLLAVNLGAPSFADWEATHEDARDIVAASTFCAEDEPDPPQLIEGILYRGAKMIIAGPSKSRKTWNLTDLAISIALGRPWCGFTTRAASVLYVNLEIARFSYRKRIRFICAGRSFDPIDLTRFHIWNRRGRENEITQLANRLRRQAARIGADLIIIDPIYKTYGDREENSNTEMAQVLNELEKLAQDTGAAVLIAAHFPKGNLTARDAIDRVAGASVFGRDPDALLIMTPHEQVDLRHNGAPLHAPRETVTSDRSPRRHLSPPSLPRHGCLAGIPTRPHTITHRTNHHLHPRPRPVPPLVQPPHRGAAARPVDPRRQAPPPQRARVVHQTASPAGGLIRFCRQAFQSCSLANPAAVLQHCSMTTTLPVSKRGSLTLPPPLRRKLGLDKLQNPMVIVEEREGGLFLQPAAAIPVRDIPKQTIQKWIARDEDEMAQFRATTKQRRK